jgi:hypothetical protein
MIFVHRSTIGNTVSAFSGGNIRTTRDARLSEALHPVKILAEAEQAVPITQKRTSSTEAVESGRSHTYHGADLKPSAG